MGSNLIVKNTAFLPCVEGVSCTIDDILLMREECGKSERRMLAMEKGKFSAMARLYKLSNNLNGMRKKPCQRYQ